MPIGKLESINEFRGFTGQKDGPVKINGAGLDASEACDLACPHCYRPPGAGKAGYLLPEIASKTMRKLREAGVTEVYFLGAEPTQNPDLPQLLQEAVNLGFKFVLLISHGLRFADEAYARQVLIPGVSLLMHRHTIDDDTLAEKIQDVSVGKLGTLQNSHAAWRNAERIFKEKGGDRLMMQCCLTDAVMNNGNLSRVFRWARESLGTKPIMEYVSPPNESYDRQIEWLTTYPLLTKRIVVQMEEFIEIDREIGLILPTYNDAVSPQAYDEACDMIKKGGQINNDGLYLPCTNMGRGSTNYAKFGNVLSGTFGQIEQNSIRQAFLEQGFRIQSCKELCRGSGCWWTGLVTTGCYRLCQLNCIFNEEKKTIDDMPDLCGDCSLDLLRQEGVIKCGLDTRPGLALGEMEKTIFKV
ncbi:radical SAM protein [Patescibacteria group bacterium]|nr:radical SAM protein [Patescibacteria group bacterium]